MARPKKQTVDYYPHFCKGGRTIFILEDKFGNDGYAFWFKVLEILGEAEGHYYDCSNASNWAFLLARTHTDEARANEIISVLIDLGKIDAELWEKKRILWVENFLKNLVPIYSQRKVSLPQKPFSGKEIPVRGNNSERNPAETEFSDEETTKEKESKEKKSKAKSYPYQGICDLWNSICVSLPKIAKLNDKRRQKIKCRLDEFDVEPEQWLSTAEELFKRVQASDFLTGRSSNKNDWRASFDWLFENPTNWVKVTEGNYDNKGKRSPQTAQNSQPCQLGVGEFIDGSGRRTYGSGRATIPNDAAPRPSERHQWSAETKTWIII